MLTFNLDKINHAMHFQQQLLVIDVFLGKILTVNGVRNSDLQ